MLISLTNEHEHGLVMQVGIGLLLLQQLSGINGVLFYSSNIFKSAGISSSKAATFGLGAIQVVATAITTSLVDKSGRRALLLHLVSKDSSLYGFLGTLALIGLVIMVSGFSLGLGPIPWVIMSEILPVNIKSLAGSVATLFNWLAASIVTMTAPLLLDWSSGGTLCMCVLCSFCWTILSSRFIIVSPRTHYIIPEVDPWAHTNEP
ncbi:putative major facilitator, sugar transporter, major facilitator superfamily [Helianthus annuus]|nr:putative major facilitator, sugar transporter, major facilitator superfamily [Helianthus annuus]KAJ0684039.1 putative major facilitator, sugar transporter, major facilitator superfamily [Helianthus annuus]KAJ0687995.1 putative major facilitator, sugar transporter, major facilitator superfamily [Helianthus annuus]